MDGDRTAAGVGIGDGPEEFRKAYSRYELMVAWNDTDSSYMVMSPREIPYEDDISILISTLFIDEEPVTAEEISEENNIDPEDVHAFISSADFLHAHDVIYRYLDFDWEDGKIADISSEELNYNESFEIPKLY